MNKDKEFQDLMDNMFRSRRVTSITAKEYLEETKKQEKTTEENTTITQLNKIKPISNVDEKNLQDNKLSGFPAQEEAKRKIVLQDSDDSFQQLHEILTKQAKEIEGMSKSLGFNDDDLHKLQKQVEQDFGVQVDLEHQQVLQSSDIPAILNEMETLQSELNLTVLGQPTFLKDLIRGFFRPHVMGIKNDELRNVLVISGPKGSGRHLGLQSLVKKLKEAHWLASDEITTLDCARYPGSDQEKVFLQDVYSAITSKSEVLVVENTEACYAPYLNQLFKLCQNEELPLSKRYILQKGQLVESNSGLVSQAVSTFKIAGKFVVFICENQKKTMQQFPTSFVNQILDKPQTTLLDEATRLAIYELNMSTCLQKAKKQLHLQVTLDPQALVQRVSVLPTNQGALTLRKDCEQVYMALSELSLKQDVSGQALLLKANPQWTFELNSEVIPMDTLIHVEKEELEEIRQELLNIVGLQEVKDMVLSMEEHYRITQRRQRQGLKADPISRHMIFTGNPGTGKTTMARLIAKLFKSLGLLSQGQLIEVSRSDLVGKYVGHTAPLTQQVIDSALGGILFIDEAYALVRGKDDSFGLEAVDTLVKGMEDHRDDLIVILAGYSKEMEAFLQSNSGLKSRFPNILNFVDYTGSELTQIACQLAKGKDYEIEPSCLDLLTIYFNTMQLQSASTKGNGRLARNTVEKAILQQSGRILKDESARMDLLLTEDFDLTAKD